MIRSGGYLFWDGNLYKFNGGSSVRQWVQRRLDQNLGEAAKIINYVDEERLIELFFDEMLDDWFLEELDETQS